MPAPSKVKTKPRPKKNAGVLDRITDVADIPDMGKKVGIYGLSGAGKTRLAATFAEDGPVLHMICSSNGVNEALSIKTVEGIKSVEIREPDDLATLVEYAEESGEFKTVVLDHVTEFGNLVLSRVAGVERMPEQGAWGQVQREHYQQMGAQVKDYLRDLFDLPLNVVVIGQERTYNTDEDGADDLIRPFVSIASTPSIAGWVAPACDYFMHAFKRKKTKTIQKKIGDKVKTINRVTDEIEYCVRIGPDPTYMTKFRVPPGVEIPAVMVDPTYAKMREYMEH